MIENDHSNPTMLDGVRYAPETPHTHTLMKIDTRQFSQRQGVREIYNRQKHNTVRGCREAVSKTQRVCSMYVRVSGVRLRPPSLALPYDYELAARSRVPAHLRERRSARRDASNERAQRGACVAVQLEGRCRLLSGCFGAGASGGERLNVGEHLVVGVRVRGQG